MIMAIDERDRRDDRDYDEFHESMAPTMTGAYGTSRTDETDGAARTAADDAGCASLCANPHPRTAVGLDASGRYLLVLLAAGRRGDAIGTLVCAAFECNANARKRPPLAYVGFDVEAARQARMEALRANVARFVREAAAGA
jgi:hypothetical protein